MAIIYFGSGKIRKSAGDYTFANFRGDTVMKAKITEMSNPRTIKQQYVRGKFLSEVKFYAHSREAYWKYSFYDKLRKESDYNAFVKNNFRNTLAIPKYWGDSNNYAMFGNWMISRGDIETPEVKIEEDQEDEGIFVYWETIPTINFAPDKIKTRGDVWKVIVDATTIKDGDIISSVVIDTNVAKLTYQTQEQGGKVLQMNNANEEPNYRRWNLYQTLVDITDTTEFEFHATGEGKMNLGNNFIVDYNKTTKILKVGFVGIVNNYNVDAKAGTIVVTRIEDGITRVSTGYLVGNQAWNDIIEEMKGDVFFVKVLSSWGASDEAFLRGGTFPARMLVQQINYK